MATKMEQETWKCLQMTMLDTTYSLLNNSSPFNAPSIASTMADSMFQALFLVWIRSEITSQEMWLDFSRKVSSLVAWKATVDEWKEKTIQLTYILIDHFYDHGAKEKDAKEKDSKETEKEGHEGEDHPPLKPDVGEAALSVPSPRSNPKSPSKQLRDAKLNSIPWTPDKINSMWYTILNILGNLCDIQDPNNFSIAMLCISDVIELLLAEEAQLAVTATPPIPIGVIFLPWILQACTVDEKRNRGRLTALATLCRIFCRRHAKPPHIDLLSHFYRVLQMSLQSNQTSMVWVIIRHASHLFSLDLPGVSVLIPDFLREIEKIWKPAQKNAVPEDVHQKSLLLAISLVCFPVHFPGLDFPTMNVSQMDALIGSILLAAIKCKDISLQDKSLCLWGLTLRTIVNLQNGPLPSKKEEIGEMVRSMVVCANHRDETVARTALDCLSTLAQPQLLLTLAQVDLNIVYYVVDNLSDNIIGLISSGKSNVQEAMNEHVIANHFFTLLDIILSVGKGQQIELTPSIVTKVFRALEWGILGEEINPSGGGGIQKTVSQTAMSTIAEKKDPPGGPPKPKKPAKSGHHRSTSERMGDTPDPRQPPASSPTHDNLFDQLKNTPSHRSDTIREAAEVFLLCMANQFKNFPTVVGSEQITCHPAEDTTTTITPGRKRPEDESPEFSLNFIYDSLYIFSLEELDKTRVRLTVRDCTGKYVWDFGITYSLDEEDHTKPLDITIPPNLCSSIVPKGPTKMQKRDNLKELPSFRNCKDMKVDSVSELLQFLSVTHDDILPPAVPSSSQRIFFNRPMAPNSVYEAGR